VTRGQLPQRAGSLGLNGGGTATAVPPVIEINKTVDTEYETGSYPCQILLVTRIKCEVDYRHLFLNC